MKKMLILAVIMSCSLAVQAEERKQEPKEVDYTMTKDTAPAEAAVEKKEEAPAPQEEAKPKQAEAPVQPAETAPGAAAEVKIGTGVTARELQGEGSSFTKETGTVYCWSLIKGAQPGTKVTHEWSLNGNKVFEIPLEVKSARSRTWSSKSITSIGNWSVKVLDEQGKELGAAAFEVK